MIFATEIQKNIFKRLPNPPQLSKCMHRLKTVFSVNQHQAACLHIRLKKEAFDTAGAVYCRIDDGQNVSTR